MKPIRQALKQVDAESMDVCKAVSPVGAIRQTLSQIVDKAISADVFINVYDVVDIGTLSTTSMAPTTP
jgi:hypothetical protein